MASYIELYSGLTRFSSELYSQVSADPTILAEGHNVFMSPLSIYVALLMTLVGAGGQTRTEIRNTLHIPPHLEGKELHKSFGSTLMGKFVESQDVNVALANRLFIIQHVNILKPFKDTIKESYSAEAEFLQKYGDLESRRQRINQWVSEKTNSKIPELLSTHSLTESTVLALINTVYFKGFWKFPFDKKKTEIQPFYCTNGTSMNVSMMSLEKSLPYTYLANLAAHAVKLPFGGSLWELLIVLPYAKEDLHKLLTHFRNTDTLASILAQRFSETSLHLKLPRFKLAELPPLDVKKLLQNAGIKALFEESADLTKLSSEENLFVSELVHKAVIEVNEEGAEAAAGTGSMISPASLSGEVYVDHPFFLALIYNSTVPTFVGHVAIPEVL